MRFGHICIGYLLPALLTNMATVGLVVYLTSSLGTTTPLTPTLNPNPPTGMSCETPRGRKEKKLNVICMGLVREYDVV